MEGVIVSVPPLPSAAGGSVGRLSLWASLARPPSSRLPSTAPEQDPIKQLASLAAVPPLWGLRPLPLRLRVPLRLRSASSLAPSGSPPPAGGGVPPPVGGHPCPPPLARRGPSGPSAPIWAGGCPGPLPPAPPYPPPPASLEICLTFPSGSRVIDKIMLY